VIGKRTTPPRRPRWPAGGLILLVSTLFLGSGGCNPTARPSDPGEGLKALQATLEAWKGGEKPEALASRSPKIHVSDGDWTSGLLLKSYRAEDEGRLVGSDLSYSVALELKNSRGKVVKKNATYAVTTHPQLLVLRQDD
jgi:hypothetical protein